VGLILDTNFVIAAEREASRRVQGPADAFLAAHGQETFFITFTIAGELACGRSATPIATVTTPLLPIAGDVRLILMKVNDCVHHELVPASKLVEMVQVIHEQTPEAQALRQHLLQQSHGVLNEEDGLSLELALADSRRMDR